ncbi:RNA helicase [Burkholderia sp. 8Y]|uniref:DEAD/DEAH box helicase n=1 Tax=Burkholderia sp. 8Y TaxID=2653133 RepID=UPI0012EF42DD|nr:DEAD/DEAH box helicase [Burkholderia sp. 8Y]VXC90642.1 RNA helicase [Burkholderia sp. 8Y]
MFDADTVSLIKQAPALPGLDLQNLPRRLTDAYATLVSARIRLRTVVDDQPLPDDIQKLVRDTNRLAFSQEALVSALGDRENRAAAAFVGGAAHHVALLANKIGQRSPRPSRLLLESIPPEVSATLLFLIAESSADAGEMAKAIVVDTDDVVEAALLDAIAQLANGRLEPILSAELPVAGQILFGNQQEQAVRALYFMLLQGVRHLAEELLGRTSDDLVPVKGSGRQFFKHVKSLCVEPLSSADDGDDLPFSVYPGPRHLASLLSSAARDLAASSLVEIPPPTGLDGGDWIELKKTIATRRPYLWRNHRQAIKAGYLTPGVSVAVSFPTGAGKSTLAELKIATALLRNKKVVFLVPTLALVDQTANSLRETFPAADVLRDTGDVVLSDDVNDRLSAISVMTPERCLAMISFAPNLFGGVGLLVFDECHLLHPRSNDSSRRAIDAMLAILNFVNLAPDADLLFLSAMMMNTGEMADWIGELTDRPALPLTLTWKPTRQVRGCVVYGDEEIASLNRLLRETRARVNNVNPPVALTRQLTVNPFGFFCLHQTWQSKSRSDYALLPLLEGTVTLATGTFKNKDWYLTPNGNRVAAAIAEATARQGLKTLVFTQTVTLANSAMENISEGLGEGACVLTDAESDLYRTAVDELGDASCLYIRVAEPNLLLSSSVCHHGLLLPSERHLHESLFKRRDGVNAMVATSTLAQGMNLPSEVVIIGGDSRFDPGAEKMERLEAHELLNAAGRAGRAGEASHGFVLVVPSKVVDFDNKKSTIHGHWTDLQAIFSQSDQCLTIDDPMTALLDDLHNNIEASPMAKYLLRRLPVNSSVASTENDEPARAMLARSLAAFRARQAGNAEWIKSRIDAAMYRRSLDPDTPMVLTWADRLAASAGIPVAIVRELGAPLQHIDPSASVSDWFEWLANWLTQRSHLIPTLVRQESLEGMFGTEYKKLHDDQAKGAHVVGPICALLRRWMAGDSLMEIEQAFDTAKGKIGKCKNAREFVVRLLPEIAYVFGLPAQIVRAIALERGDSPQRLPLALELLGTCVRQGFDSVDKYVLRGLLLGKPARRAVHRKYIVIEPLLMSPEAGEHFAGAHRRVRTAVEMSA